eukprot:491198_1
MGNIFDADTVDINVTTTTTDRCIDKMVHVARFNCSFVVTVPYTNKTTRRDVKNKIIKHMNNKYYPTTFVISDNDILPGSFLPKRNSYNMLTNESITNYKKSDIKTKGLCIRTQVALFEHKIKLPNISCEHMIAQNTKNPFKCPIYYAMKEKYEWSKKNLHHLNEFSHFKDAINNKPECIYKDKSFKRLEEGGFELKDICHIKLFRHPPRCRGIKLQQNTNSLIINHDKEDNHPIYEPTSDDEKKHSANGEDGYLNALIEEVVLNGYKKDLCLTNDIDEEKYSILNIVDEKLKSHRHKLMGCPLNRGEMLALILYTGCECNYDLCKSQRNGDYMK